ncbi:MAG: helix-turn-helix domain-containing protein [Treponema sp.]|jgi:AraC-like DNA-binding protein/ligand-binding sensor protein|nr:helix-turn-helix domain-containing protein [Treponema sp.]
MKGQKSITETQQRTDPLLLKARHILASYTRSTGTMVGILDHNGQIPEALDDVVNDRNICLYCMKCQSNTTVTRSSDFKLNPCVELHNDEMKKSQSSGGISTYMCDLGFMFWTNPVYSGKHSIGSVIGSGVLGVDREETVEKMLSMCNGADSREYLQNLISIFPKAAPKHVSALSELMYICSESIMHNNSSFYDTLKRRADQQKKLVEITRDLRNKYNASPLPEYPIDKERAFLGAIRHGNLKKGLLYLDELLGILLFTYPGDFKNIQLRILELALMLTQTENASRNISEIFSNASRQFLKAIEEAENPEDLVDAIHLMTRYLAETAFSFQGIRHGSALKKADQYIKDNFARKISLEEIAAASGLSAPYFSTIFKDEMGESLSGYLNRLRVEKAACLLAETEMPLSEITHSCGFGDQSWFSKIFKIYAGVKPNEFRQKRRARHLDFPASKFSKEYMALVRHDNH